MTGRDLFFMGVGAVLLVLLALLAFELACWRDERQRYNNGTGYTEYEHEDHWHRVPSWHWKWAQRLHAWWKARNCAHHA